MKCLILILCLFSLGALTGCLESGMKTIGSITGSSTSEKNYEWVYGDWGGCSATTCNATGVELRQVLCRDNDGSTVSDSFCSSQPKPASSRSCSAPSCSFTYSWQESGFGACSATTCGTSGTQTQTVICKRNDGQTVADSFCTTTKPATSKACSADPCQSANNYYVRTDGGTSAQCNGKSNAAYSGSGSNQNCAWKSITYALSIRGTPLIKSGDTLNIASGTYKIGHGQAGAETNTGSCNSAWTYECYMAPVPSGVTIQGDCNNRPKLVGVERTTVLSLTNTNNATVRCLEITDGAACIESHMHGKGGSAYTCNRSSYPYGEWAGTGITATDSSNVLLDRVNVHGLANRGIVAGRINNWELRDSNIDGNGWAGWDGDVGSNSNNTGYIKFVRTTIRWNGCVELLNGSHDGCWGQQNGGYGDGLGTGATGGHWLFDGAIVEYNTSDGIDLLYVNKSTSDTSVTVKNSWVGHNAGNQVKTSRNALVENNVVIGDCAYHTKYSTMENGDICRAMGNVLSLATTPGDTVTVKNNTVTSQGDCLVLTGGSGGQLNMSGNIFDARTDWRQNFENSCFHYHDGSGLTTSFTNNLVYNNKGGCPANQTCADPKFVNPAFESFDPRLQTGSPATGKGADLSLVPVQ